LNQPLPEESSEYSASHHSVMGSIHPTNIHEGSEAMVGGNRGTPKVRPDWLNQLVTEANDNNPIKP